MISVGVVVLFPAWSWWFPCNCTTLCFISLQLPNDNEIYLGNENATSFYKNLRDSSYKKTSPHRRLVLIRWRVPVNALWPIRTQNSAVLWCTGPSLNVSLTFKKQIDFSRAVQIKNPDANLDRTEQQRTHTQVERRRNEQTSQREARVADRTLVSWIDESLSLPLEPPSLFLQSPFLHVLSTLTRPSHSNTPVMPCPEMFYSSFTQQRFVKRKICLTSLLPKM